MEQTLPDIYFSVTKQKIHVFIFILVIIISDT